MQLIYRLAQLLNRVMWLAVARILLLVGHGTNQILGILWPEFTYWYSVARISLTSQPASQQQRNCIGSHQSICLEPYVSDLCFPFCIFHLYFLIGIFRFVCPVLYYQNWMFPVGISRFRFLYLYCSSLCSLVCNIRFVFPRFIFSDLYFSDLYFPICNL